MSWRGEKRWTKFCERIDPERPTSVSVSGMSAFVRLLGDKRTSSAPLSPPLCPRQLSTTIRSGLPAPRGPAILDAMRTLTCRRQQDRHQECWRVFFGDVQVGTIGERGCRLRWTSGAGTTGSLRRWTVASALTAPPRRSRRRAPPSRPHGAATCRLRRWQSPAARCRGTFRRFTARHRRVMRKTARSSLQYLQAKWHNAQS
jgi:hypothetical protein